MEEARAEAAEEAAATYERKVAATKDELYSAQGMVQKVGTRRGGGGGPPRLPPCARGPRRLPALAPHRQLPPAHHHPRPHLCFLHPQVSADFKP